MPRVAAAERLAAYRPRDVEFSGVREVAGFRLKVYTITAPGREAADEVADAAIALAERVLKETSTPSELPAHGVGFLIVHFGEDANWVLVDWWVDGCILSQRLFRAPAAGSLEFDDMSETPLACCVWEGEVLDFERRAFIETMMIERPNPTAYLVRTLSGAV